MPAFSLSPTALVVIKVFAMCVVMIGKHSYLVLPVQESLYLFKHSLILDC